MRTFQRSCVAVVLGIAATVFTPTGHAGRGTAPQAIEGLGAATFPTSATSSAAQAAFQRGLLLLHLFEYSDAAEAFRQAGERQPGFAMAHWGEAMAHNAGIWNRVDVDAGREALARLAPTPRERAEMAPTAREKGYLAAVEILYSGEGTKQERDTRYCEAMQRLAAAYPDDAEAQLFHALARMGRNEGVRDEADYLAAARIAEDVFRINPRHPGAAHYWIHGMDDPVHAAGALQAAHALSKIAPHAAHAQHMTSHIFIALGMWDEVVEANINAVRVANAQARAGGEPQVECGHYAEWLAYGRFQQGRVRDGERALNRCAEDIPVALAWIGTRAQESHAGHAAPARAAEYLYGSLAIMRGIALVESRHWSGDAATLAVDASALGSRAAWNEFAIGYAAAERGDLARAQQASGRLHELREQPPVSETELQQLPGYLAVMDDSLRGLLLVRQEHVAEGLATIRQAAQHYDSMAFDFGPPVPLKPPHELLGEQLLRAGQPEQAVAEFQAALKRAPNRSLALLGLARAQAAAHDADAATATYRKLLANWHAADEDLPALAEARKRSGD